MENEYCAGIILIVIGVIILREANSILEYSVRYDNDTSCYNKATCRVQLNIGEDMQPPIFVFYELHNFYQNHRKYVSSKSSKQLSGMVVDNNTADTECYPVSRMKNLGYNTTYKSKELKPEDVANPCGLIAKSYFNGKYFLDYFMNFLLLVAIAISHAFRYLQKTELQ